MNGDMTNRQGVAIGFGVTAICMGIVVWSILDRGESVWWIAAIVVLMPAAAGFKMWTKLRINESRRGRGRA